MKSRLSPVRLLRPQMVFVSQKVWRQAVWLAFASMFWLTSTTISYSFATARVIAGFFVAKCKWGAA